MSRNKSLKSLGDWIGVGGHSFDGSLLQSDDDSASRQLALERIIPGRYQPRQRTDEGYLAELERSIRQFGVIEPLVVRPLMDGSYEILAGHMRWQAAQQAGLTTVPVVVREADDRTAAAIALVENLLRRELNPIEEARGLRRLREEFALTQEQLAALLGISQPAISKTLRLLNLEPMVQALIEEGKLEAGHGNTLLGLERAAQIRLAEQTVENSWSVRELERRRSSLLSPPAPRTVLPRDPDLVRLEEGLQERLAAPVRLHYNAVRQHGRIEITFSSVEECEGILEKMGLVKTEK